MLKYSFQLNETPVTNLDNWVDESGYTSTKFSLNINPDKIEYIFQHSRCKRYHGLYAMIKNGTSVLSARPEGVILAYEGVGEL